MDISITSAGHLIRGALRRIRARSSLVDTLIGRTEILLEWLTLLAGACVHAFTGTTPQRAHMALVHLFASSSGRANDWLARGLSILYPPYTMDSSNGVLGKLGETDLARIQKQLESDGFCVFNDCLPAGFCEAVVRQSLEANCLVLGDEFAQRREKVYDRYDRERPYAPKYILTEDDTTNIPEVQQLLCDASLIRVAQIYLRAKPIFTGLSLWWNAPVKDTPDDNAAQEFHWDMERIRWLRFFIYLTDVTVDSGPHCFIAGSHRSGAIPEELLKQGYVRHKDETILQLFGRDRYREFLGARGTIIAEDSRGLHKGMMPRRGDRLMLAFELSSSTFGANKRHLIRNIHVPQFRDFARRFPRLYTNFDFKEGLLD